MQNQYDLKNKETSMYDLYKTLFFTYSLTIVLAYFYGIAYSYGYFGEVKMTLQEIWSEVLILLREPWFYIITLSIPTIRLFFTKKKHLGFHRFDMFEPSKSFWIGVLSILGGLVALLIIYISYPYFASIYTLLFVIVASSRILFMIFQRVFTVDDVLYDTDQLSMKDEN